MDLKKNNLLEGVVKKSQNYVHVVIECPLDTWGESRLISNTPLDETISEVHIIYAPLDLA